jgi:hypothetical protein
MFEALKDYHSLKEEDQKAAFLEGGLSILSDYPDTTPVVRRGLKLFIQKEKQRHVRERLASYRRCDDHAVQEDPA